MDQEKKEEKEREGTEEKETKEKAKRWMGRRENGKFGCRSGQDKRTRTGFGSQGTERGLGSGPEKAAEVNKKLVLSVTGRPHCLSLSPKCRRPFNPGMTFLQGSQ